MHLGREIGQIGSDDRLDQDQAGWTPKRRISAVHIHRTVASFRKLTRYDQGVIGDTGKEIESYCGCEALDVSSAARPKDLQ